MNNAWPQITSSSDLFFSFPFAQRFSMVNNLIKSKMCVVSFLFVFFVDTLISNDFPYGVTLGFIFSTDQKAMSLLNR